MTKKDKYSKPGKGVSKNQPEKRALFAFGELYSYNVCVLYTAYNRTYPSHDGRRIYNRTYDYSGTFVRTLPLRCKLSSEKFLCQVPCMGME